MMIKGLNEVGKVIKGSKVLIMGLMTYKEDVPDTRESPAAGIVEGLTGVGVYHFVNEGCCSWYDFAREIFDIFILGEDVRAAPIRSDELDVMYTARYLGAEGFDVLSFVLAFTGIFMVPHIY